MRKLVFILLIIPSVMLSQVIDDFSDGDFSQNPTWSGNTESYIVNSAFQLQTNGSGAGESYLSVPYEGGSDMEWRFWIRENFSPSANNYTDVYLVSNNADLMSVTEGYFIRFGEAGSNDAIEFFKRQGVSVTSLIRGTDGNIANSFQVSVKVTCDAEGNWSLMTDYGGGDSYALEGECNDNDIQRGGYFGFYSKYTASNATKTFFDNIYIGAPIVDIEPPQLLSVGVIGQDKLTLTFNESLLPATATLVSNYSVDHGIGSPQTASCQGSEVVLEFGSAFTSDVNYTLTVQGISDLSGNTMGVVQKQFSTHIFSSGDVVINEIMADPTPVVGLPEYEYIELYNTTGAAISLQGCVISIGNNSNTFADVSIESGGYLILCHNDALVEMSVYGECVGFTSFSIANTSAMITLMTEAGDVISQAAFSSSWYHDSAKDDGGYSVEQIDPLSPCMGALNWRASNEPSGGTPGRVNSVDGVIDASPALTSINMFGDNVIQLHFDQPMDIVSLQEAEYKVVENSAIPVQVNTNPNDATFVELVFGIQFTEGTLYTLSVGGLLNCKGIAMGYTEVPFGLPSMISEGDVLINEILFDPISGGVKYVELYNNTSFTFDVSDLRLGMIKTTFPNPADTTMKTISIDGRLFVPGTYLLLSTNVDIVAQQYECSIDNYVNMSSFPNYPSSGATVLLSDKGGNIIDRFDYSEKLHSPLLKETKGVSLERVSPDVASDNADNWHSAAENAHFGTPGRINSMAQDASLTDDAIEITPEVFSPDGDGIDDVCMINYNFDEIGYTMNVYIFNADGQLVRHLARGTVVGQQGSLPWNGFDDNGGRLPVGIYIVITEVYNDSGKVSKQKTPVVIMSR